jgi:hypothetical protein
MTELQMTVRNSGQRPKYDRAAAGLLELCREFYQDPENERAFQEWKARKDGKDEKAAV